MSFEEAAKVVDEDLMEEEELVFCAAISLPIKFVSAREASVLSMKDSVLFHAYASASKDRTTSIDADGAEAAATGSGHRR